MTQYKLGKKAARHGAIKLRFGAFFDQKIIDRQVPKVFGHESIGQPWGMLANDDVSDCVVAGGMHEHMAWAHGRGDAVPEFRDRDVLADYSAITGYNPKDPDTDQGTDMAEAASYRRKTGLIDAAGNRHKIDAFLEVRVGDPDALAMATWLTGAVGVGVRWPSSGMKQFDHQKPFGVVAHDGIEGGHYMACIGRNSGGDFLVVTWGRLQAMSPAWFSKYCDEVVCYISSVDMMRDRLLADAFDADGLQQQLRALAA